jgi:class 3 adenylate cyclase
VRISFENRAARRTMPGIWLHSEEMDKLTNTRRPFLTATRLLSNQAFRDLYRSGTFDPEQRFKITSLTILFTDLRGSTALYDRIGDLAAFDLVRSHFGALLEAVSAEGGAVVKTIGDAVMATFPTPDRALRAAMRMRGAMRGINQTRGGEDLALNIGLHSGPCLAVMLDDRQDFFGQTVNIASRVNELADPTAILVTKPVIESSEVAAVLSEASYRTTPRSSQLRGLSNEFEIFEVREREAAAAAA